MTPANKQWCLNNAIEIIKEYAKNNNAIALDIRLEEIYKKLKELGEDAWKEL